MNKSNNGVCIVCNSTFKKYCNHQKYCGEKCRKVEHKKLNKKFYNSSLNYLTTAQIGAVSELEMCAYYIREGYEVFRNVSASGPADIIVWKPETGEFHIIDIKSYVNSTAPGNYITNEERKRDFKVKVVPYNYNDRMPLRHLPDDL